MEYRPPVQTDTLTLPSGRVLAWCIYGGPLYTAEGTAAPTVIFYCHGFPGSRLEPAYLRPAMLQDHHARFVALDRPGMGQSTHYSDRRLLDWPDDVLAVADHLGVETFHVLGISGGAPYALACAYAIPRTVVPNGRLRGVGVISGIYPPSIGGLDKMLMGIWLLLGAGAWLPRFATGMMLDLEMGRAARNPDPTVLERQVDRAMARRQEVERQAYAEPQVRDTAILGMREAFRHGAAGVATDLMLVSDWGFELGEIADGGRGIKIWHGRQDLNTPFAMAEKAGQLLPEAELTFYDDTAHLSTPARYAEEIIASLLRE